MSTQVFVYGTLKRGCSNHREMADQAFVAEARTVPGFRLFDVGGYPGLVPWPEDTEGVEGEIWSVNDATLARLDAFEGVDEGLYERKPVPLQPPFAHQVVHGYRYPASVAGRREIGSRWVE